MIDQRVYVRDTICKMEVCVDFTGILSKISPPPKKKNKKKQEN